MRVKELMPGIYRAGRELATVNLTPGRRVYGERLLRHEGRELRLWNPRRSKLAAALMLGLDKLPLHSSSRVLYIGAAQGTTASHVSDIAKEGVVYCVEVSPRAAHSLLRLAEQRHNLIPILADASSPEEYAFLLERVDVIYQDVAQPEMGEILLKNARLFLRKGGHVLYFIKARSIRAEKPERIFEEEIERLRSAGVRVLQALRLEPYEKDHMLVLGRWQG
ncbi:MAG: fibrillarin-like rRNA/tRNA 2'-O-methyltransferase [Euryarchaeota archaeon]|nr:fibrillarin-like rRNA/tRNA 2'-O-methyltransferase [Euryarchaeota archaeon]